MKFIAIIPARFASTRFPGKPLALLGGKTIIQRVYEQAGKAVEEVYVATDDERIARAVKEFGGKVVMTSNQHRSGTDRINEAVVKLGTDADVIINIQGDEPFVLPEQIVAVCKCFNDDRTQIATLGKPFGNDAGIDTLRNPNSPKIVVDNNDCAMYFSRSIIPFVRGKEEDAWLFSFPFLKHIGLYAYKTEVLKEITSLPQSSLEMAECLEQLRWLQNGYKIKVGITDAETIGIDTPDDLKRAETFLHSNHL
ncbi:3-deoxy-manno-octulosonate cytidylyltransferase [Prevotella sp. OH937_COT-195]|uniref:3-deoxy-manno-octulosonate cytidylyltransferase n=1 Tax=Prevotella sp. OH937_COT-195 TaxID=2491051 RepID=UPI000F655C27|nr:3-deoxy-manno-octulosonate cytidylyltransferase [Prevotella sp. OH937_COT-195]RRD02221.1 3-deoxy-manno-octulosonate cytidylyltransferase [Prevotella sp. OH937_COT-195]